MRPGPCDLYNCEDFQTVQASSQQLITTEDAAHTNETEVNSDLEWTSKQVAKSNEIG